MKADNELLWSIDPKKYAPERVLPHVFKAVCVEFNSGGKFNDPWGRVIAVIRDLMLSGF